MATFAVLGPHPPARRTKTGFIVPATTANPAVLSRPPRLSQRPRPRPSKNRTVRFLHAVPGRSAVQARRSLSCFGASAPARAVYGPIAYGLADELVVPKQRAEALLFRDFRDGQERIHDVAVKLLTGTLSACGRSTAAKDSTYGGHGRKLPTGGVLTPTVCSWDNSQINGSIVRSRSGKCHDYRLSSMPSRL